MALSGLDIYKLLPKTNCRECGFPTCLAFAMQLAKKAVSIDKCPYVSEDSKAALEASSLPPIRLVTIGTAEFKTQIGNETVLFRHEEKFHHPAAIGFIIDDDSPDAAIKQKLSAIRQLKFERVGQLLKPDIIALRQKGGSQRFIDALKLILDDIPAAPALMVKDIPTLKQALELSKDKVPLVYPLDSSKAGDFAAACLESKVPLVVSANDLDAVAAMARQLSGMGLRELILEVKSKSQSARIWDLTCIRRLALKKGERSLGYPAMVVLGKDGAYDEVIAAAGAILKYAGIVLMESIESWQALGLLTLRQNIYTDPQKPLQIEPKIYSIGQAGKESPLLVTTNFSLTYYTVLGEVEASKVPVHIMSVDTEGMSVLTAWAAEKFSSEKIAQALIKSGAGDVVSHKRLVLPGYVAVLSGELEDKSQWQVLVGPKEASGLSSFLKNL